MGVWFYLYELITKKQPFAEADNDINYIKKCITNNEDMPELPTHCSPFLAKLVKECWEPERENRPTFHQIIEMIRTQMS